MVSVLVTWLVVVTKDLTKSTYGKKDLFLLTVQPITAGMSWQKDLEAAGHLVYSVRKQSVLSPFALGQDSSVWHSSTHI